MVCVLQRFWHRSHVTLARLMWWLTHLAGRPNAVIFDSTITTTPWGSCTTCSRSFSARSVSKFEVWFSLDHVWRLSRSSRLISIISRRTIQTKFLNLFWSTVQPLSRGNNYIRKKSTQWIILDMSLISVLFAFDCTWSPNQLTRCVNLSVTSGSWTFNSCFNHAATIFLCKRFETEKELFFRTLPEISAVYSFRWCEVISWSLIKILIESLPIFCNEKGY